MRLRWPKLVGDEIGVAFVLAFYALLTLYVLYDQFIKVYP